MNRRSFIKQSVGGVMAIAVGARFGPFFDDQAHAQGSSVINLGMTTADVEMVDTIDVPHWVYTVRVHDHGSGAMVDKPTLPGPFIFAFANETFTINVTNSIPPVGVVPANRRFAIVGNDFAGNQFALLKQTVDIPPGQARSVTINAGDLRPGTYIYKDPTLDPLSRVLGLHGVLVVLPNPAFSVHNPYAPFTTPNVRALFNDLGQGQPRNPGDVFPGDPWFATTDANPLYDPLADPPSSESDLHHHQTFSHGSGEDGHSHGFINSPVFERFLYRSRVWVFSSIDPELNQSVIENGIVPPDPRAVFKPRYFSVNGRQGVFGAHGPDVTVSSTIGEPHVVRMVNVGLNTTSPHPHGNHVYILAVNNIVGGAAHAAGAGDGMGALLSTDNLFLIDTFDIDPEGRLDVLLPYLRPQDIPKILDEEGLLLPLDQLLSQELSLVLTVATHDLDHNPLPEPLTVAQDILSYPMHSHMELDQTAAGGNYPQGQVTHFEIIGEYGKDFSFRRERRRGLAPQLKPLLLDE